MFIEKLEQVDSFYKTNLDPRRLVIGLIPKRTRLTQLLLPLFATGVISAIIVWENVNPFIKLSLFVAGVFALGLFIRFRFSSELDALSELEHEYEIENPGYEMSYMARLSRIQQQILLRFGKIELGLKRKELVKLGEGIDKNYPHSRYQVQSPVALLAILFAAETVFLMLFELTKLSEIVKVQIIAFNIGGIFLIIFGWLILKGPVENQINSQVTRYFAIRRILMGLDYETKSERKRKR